MGTRFWRNNKPKRLRSATSVSLKKKSPVCGRTGAMSVKSFSRTIRHLALKPFIHAPHLNSIAKFPKHWVANWRNKDISNGYVPKNNRSPCFCLWRQCQSDAFGSVRRGHRKYCRGHGQHGNIPRNILNKNNEDKNPDFWPNCPYQLAHLRGSLRCRSHIVFILVLIEPAFLAQSPDRVVLYRTGYRICPYFPLAKL